MALELRTLESLAAFAFGYKSSSHSRAAQEIFALITNGGPGPAKSRRPGSWYYRDSYETR